MKIKEKVDLINQYQMLWLEYGYQDNRGKTERTPGLILYYPTGMDHKIEHRVRGGKLKFFPEESSGKNAIQALKDFLLSWIKKGVKITVHIHNSCQIDPKIPHFPPLAKMPLWVFVGDFYKTQPFIGRIGL